MKFLLFPKLYQFLHVLYFSFYMVWILSLCYEQSLLTAELRSELNEQWTDLYWENTKCHYLKMRLLLGSSDYMERNFSVSCLWSKNLDASNLEGSHWNRSGGIINLYLIPLVNKQGTLFHSQLFLVSRNLRSLWFNFLETKIPVIYLSSHLAPE